VSEIDNRVAALEAELRSAQDRCFQLTQDLRLNADEFRDVAETMRRYRQTIANLRKALPKDSEYRWHVVQVSDNHRPELFHVVRRTLESAGTDHPRWERHDENGPPMLRLSAERYAAELRAIEEGVEVEAPPCLECGK
jgi:chromosome segregation ATPase